MKAVYLDGEDVTFSGDAPANIQILVDLINQHLAHDERILISCKVDDVDILHKDPNQYPYHGDTIHMTSQSIRLTLIAAIEDTLASTHDLAQQLVAFAGEILCQPWSKTLQQIDDLTAMLAPIYQLADNLHQYANRQGLSWQHTLDDFLQSRERVLSEFIKAAKDHDVAPASDVICHQIAPQVEAIRRSYQETILPRLQAG